jgi:putative hydrolase of the HAD superfamily
MVHNKNCDLVIIDLDDTLIDTSDVFWRARNSYIDLFKDKDIDLSSLVELFEKFDTINSNNYGHTPHRYKKTMYDTYIHLLKTNKIIPDENIRSQIEVCGNIILKDIPTLIDGALDLLEFISTNYKCILLTRGAEWLQKRKIEVNNLRRFFSDIIIVNTKNEKIYKDIAFQYNVVPNKCWVIGDSIKSDINPALISGMNAILYKYSHHEYFWIQEYNINPIGSFYLSMTLKDIINIIERPSLYSKVSSI